VRDGAVLRRGGGRNEGGTMRGGGRNEGGKRTESGGGASLKGPEELIGHVDERQIERCRGRFLAETWLVVEIFSLPHQLGQAVL